MQSKISTVLIAIVLLSAVVVGLMAFRNAFLNRSIDSYSITYEVTSDVGVESVLWTGAPDGDRTGASVERSAHSPLGVPFTTDAVVAAGEPARIQATPVGEGAASCRIVKDVGMTDEAVLAEATSATPGASVTCEATMPIGKGFKD